MSIPPLVCNTPPPPDQCEDDKEDFDIHYNLSPEDEDEFDFQSFSTYNNFKSNSNEKWEMASEIIQHKDILSSLEENNSKNEIPSLSKSNESVKQVEEEVNLEDLNLSVDPEETNSKSDSSNIDEDYRNQQVNASDDHKEQDQDYSNKLDFGDKNTLKTDSDSIDYFENAVKNLERSYDELEIKTTLMNEPCMVQPNPNEEITNDDDFGDFEDFQAANGPSIINDSVNPWDCSSLGESSNINFEANFDSFQAVNEESFNSSQEKVVETVENDDDFGDFDDFQSSASAVREQELCTPEGSINNQATIWNLGKPENEAVFLENVNKLLESVFEHEVSETELVLENKLEGSLGEAWRYLIDTDERQPYMVAWNSSSGQKTLLKALCIDSRNILFGPKWSSNMPKYAVTLSNAPLQPQKQAASTSTTTEDSTVDNQSNKAASNWVDPFMTDGQESCNAEKENTAAEPRPSDIDMFASTITKNDKIFASTLSIQPIRQISLPDTHIFTPTDSETPRSKTIHYDNSPSILLPTSIPDNSKSQFSNVGPHPHQETTNDKVQSDDYWEFQDFKGTSEFTPATTQSTPSSVLPQTNILRETQILQPVKVELIMPTLNWPEPGEVKETFDDFSDFISKTVPKDEAENQANVETLATNIVQHSDINSIPNTILSKNPALISNEHLDDDFDTFQSALPQNIRTSEITSSSISISRTNNNYKESNIHHMMPEFSSNAASHLRFNTKTDIDSFFVETMKPDSLSQPHVKSTTDITPSNINLTSKDNTENARFCPKSTPSQKPEYQPMNILQPTPANSNMASQKGGQILQPLSLESYSQINWPNPGIDLQDLSKFNPVESLQSLKSDLGSGSQSKVASPIHNHKVVQQAQEDDWGEFISSKPKQQQVIPNSSSFVEDDEWSDFMSSPVVKPINGLNTISLNVHTNSNIQKNSPKLIKKQQAALDIPTLNYITPKSSGNKSYNVDRHLQRL